MIKRDSATGEYTVANTQYVTWCKGSGERPSPMPDNPWDPWEPDMKESGS